MRRGVHGIDLHPSAATPSVSPNRRFLCGFSARAADANFSAALRPRTPMIEPSRFIILARSPRSSPSSLPPSPSFSISRRKRWKETAKPIESLTTMIGNWRPMQIANGSPIQINTVRAAQKRRMQMEEGIAKQGDRSLEDRGEKKSTNPGIPFRGARNTRRAEI